MFILLLKKQRFPFSLPLAWSITILLTVLIVLELAFAPWNSVTTIYLPTILANAVLLIVFGRTLRPTKEPIISSFCRIERGNLPSDLIRYTRTVTWIWTTLFAIITLFYLTLSFHSAPMPIYIFAYGLYYSIILILILGEYVYRLFRFRQHSHLNPISFFIKISQSRQQRCFS
jgi:uncharacterized membrane protein